MSFLISFLFLFFTGVTPENNINGYQPGDIATDFKLMSTDGDMVSLSDFPNAKGFIIVFTCNHCPFAIKYEDRMIDIAKRYRALGYEMIAINPNDPEVQPADSYELMKVRAEEKGFIFPYLFDEGQKIYPQYGATKTPHVYLLDKNRVVQYIGAIDDNVNNPDEVEEKYLEKAILALENGQQPSPNITKAVGCSIKVKK
jgi:peroxiredoxin